MDLNEDQLNELFDRANEEWEKAKNNNCPPPSLDGKCPKCKGNIDLIDECGECLGTGMSMEVINFVDSLDNQSNS